MRKGESMRIPVRARGGETVLVRLGFTKQNGMIPSFSIPRVWTCLGMTAWCARYCYAKQGNHILPVVRKAREDNLKLTLRDDFSEIMVAALEKLKAKGYRIVRLHEEGDFYSASYILKWISVVERFPEILFYAYTRSWRLPELLPYLEKLRELPNFILIASTDEYTGPPPRGWKEAGINFCYRKPNILCPSYKVDGLTCDKCGICFKTKLNVYFLA
jgi:hypothetical protein